MVRPLDPQTPQQIRVNPVLGVRRAGPRRPIDRLKTQKAHQPSRPAAPDPHPLAAKMANHLAGAVERILQEQLVDPKAAARAIGQAGTAAAGAIARDAASAGKVPGYAGTNPPERNIGADDMETAARARLADPDDPGGAAGRAVVEGVTARPDVPVTLGDLGVMRGKAVAADAKQLDAVDAGKPFVQLQAAGMKTAVMDEIMRQRDPALREAVEASLAGEIGRAFGKLGSNVAEAKPDNLAGAAAARWLALSPDDRANTGLMAPSHTLRERINEIVRERLVRDGAVHGPTMKAERLVSRGYSNAEKTLAANYAPGDTVAFHRPYKRLGVDKGDELRVTGVDRRAHTVTLQGKGGREVAWDPNRLAARTGGVEVYRAEEIELRAGDRIRWTRNDMGLGLVNSGIAEVAAVRDGRVTFRLEDGRMLDLRPGDPQLRHVDRAWASTVHAFQGRTVDNVIAAMEARHAKLTTQKSFYVEISRARDRAELVTDDREALREQLEAVTGERIAALEAVGRADGAGRDGAKDAGQDRAQSPGRGSGRGVEKTRAPKGVDRELSL